MTSPANPERNTSGRAPRRRVSIPLEQWNAYQRTRLVKSVRRAVQRSLVLQLSAFGVLFVAISLWGYKEFMIASISDLVEPELKVLRDEVASARAARMLASTAAQEARTEARRVTEELTIVREDLAKYQAGIASLGQQTQTLKAATEMAVTEAAKATQELKDLRRDTAENISLVASGDTTPAGDEQRRAVTFHWSPPPNPSEEARAALAWIREKGYATFLDSSGRSRVRPAKGLIEVVYSCGWVGRKDAALQALQKQRAEELAAELQAFLSQTGNKSLGVVSRKESDTECDNGDFLPGVTVIWP